MKRRLAISLLLLGAMVTLVLTVDIPFRGAEIELLVSERAPLAARVTARSRRPTSLSVRLHGIDGEDIVRKYDNAVRERTIQLLGLYPGRDNEVIFTQTAENGGVSRIIKVITTDPLPEIYPEVGVEVLQPESLAPGMTFLYLGAYDGEGEYHPLASAVDRHGRVRWIYRGDYGHLLFRLGNGNLMIQEESRLREVNMLGWPRGVNVAVSRGVHHDALELPSGDFLVLSAAPDSFDDGVLEIARETGTLLNSWDFRNILDPERPRQPINLEERDWLHLNGIDYDAVDNSFVVSGRDQSAVVKVDRTTGALQWILANPAYWPPELEPYLLRPVGEPFSWPWGQHAPMVDPDNGSRILIYDNGNHRSYDAPLRPGENYSRAVEYEIDEDSGTVRQVWQYGEERGAELFTPFIGDADYLENGNRLVTFGGVSRDLDGNPQALFDLEAMEVNEMKISAHVVEVTGELPARRVMELIFEDTEPDSYAGYRVYRAERMSLYPEGRD